jgi:hypothetical protein
MVNINGLSRRWAAVIGLILILGSEYLLRDAFISKGASRRINLNECPE